ncbi:MAG: hypothetical protein ACTSRL_03970 [Candidatus Helarchaeota archaeon]
MVMWLAIWIISGTRFHTSIFFIIYFIAILPNLITLSTSFSLDAFIMSFFDSIYLYLLFPVYLGALLLKRFLTWWQQRRRTVSPHPHTSAPSRAIAHAIEQVRDDLATLDLPLNEETL